MRLPEPGVDGTVWSRARPRRKRLLEVARRATGLQAQITAEVIAQRPVHRQRVGLTPRPVEGEHQLSVEDLAERVFGGEGVQVAHQIAVLSEGQLGLDQQFRALQAGFLVPGGEGTGGRYVFQAVQRGPPAQRQGGPERHDGVLVPLGPRLGAARPKELLEFAQVECVVPEDQRISR